MKSIIVSYAALLALGACATTQHATFESLPKSTQETLVDECGIAPSPRVTRRTRKKRRAYDRCWHKILNATNLID